MKKFSALLLIISILLSLAACGVSAAQPEGQKVQESPKITESPKLPEKASTVDESSETESPLPAEETESRNAEESEPESMTGDQELDELAEIVISAITTEETDKRTKARAVYDFVRGSVNYSGSSDKTDWKTAAKEGLKTRQGDCFTYYAVARALLKCLGIENREVQRVDGRSEHWWNLVNCGDGWYHMDATPMGAEMPPFNAFMFTDEQARHYTELVQYEVGLTNFYSFNGDGLPARAS